MTSADAFLQASPTYRDAMRHPFKSGEALQVFRGRSRPGIISAWAWAVLPHLIGVAAFLAVVGLVVGARP